MVTRSMVLRVTSPRLRLLLLFTVEEKLGRCLRLLVGMVDRAATLKLRQMQIGGALLDGSLMLKKLTFFSLGQSLLKELFLVETTSRSGPSSQLVLRLFALVAL